MKKIVYIILICIIIAGIIIIPTIGLNADLIYSKNVQIDVYLGKTFNMNDMENLVNEVFPNEKNILQQIEVFEDMVAITIPDTRTEEELNTKIEELTTKINEKYELKITSDNVQITHNPKVRLSSIVIPYALWIGISVAVILVYVAIRYRKLGIVKTLLTYIISIAAVELLLLSIIAITRYPVNRIIIPLGLVAFVIVVTVLGIKNEAKLEKVSETKRK